MQNHTFRQPSVFVSLPSQGKWWPPHAMQITNPSGELGVQSMTVKDEMALKSPDALMNGVAVVNTIQSCCPDIKDAWHIPAMDLDSILVAIRIATYGPKLEVDSIVPKVDVKKTLSIDLNQLMDSIVKKPFQDTHTLKDGTVIQIRPMNYRDVTNNNVRTYEQARLASSIEKSTVSESEKVNQIQKAFINITNMTVDALAGQLVAVKYQGQEDITDIKSFVNSIPAVMANEIKETINSQKDIGTIPPMTIQTDQEEIDQGAPATYKQNINLDYSNFFVYKY